MEKKKKYPMSRSFFHLPVWDDESWDLDVGGQSGLSVSEDKNHVYVEAQLPGLKSDQIEISFEKGMLWISGEKKEEETDKEKRYYRKASSSFSYRIHVPGQVDEKNDPEATYKDGVLTVTFRKTSDSPTKKIPIKPQ